MFRNARLCLCKAFYACLLAKFRALEEMPAYLVSYSLMFVFVCKWIDGRLLFLPGILFLSDARHLFDEMFVWVHFVIVLSIFFRLFVCMKLCHGRWDVTRTISNAGLSIGMEGCFYCYRYDFMVIGLFLIGDYDCCCGGKWKTHFSWEETWSSWSLALAPQSWTRFHWQYNLCHSCYGLFFSCQHAV